MGFAGANLAGTDFGLGQFATLLTLEGLTYAGVDGRPTARLAEAWAWENNNLRLRVTLRSGVRFHDGTPLDSAVAVRILTSLVAQEGNRALYPSLTDIVRIAPDGPRHVLIDLARPSALLPEDLSVPFEFEDGERGVGTGPYRVVSREETELVLERFNAYYRGTPSISRVVVVPFDALRTAWSSLLRGEVDMVSDVPPDAVEFVRTDDVQVITFARGYQYLIAFNSQRAPFTSSNVRRALNIALNRDRLISARLQKSGVPATGPLWPQHWAYDSSIRPFSYDPQLAASMLDAEGLKLPSTPSAGSATARLRFACLVPAGFAVLERIALEVQKQLYDIGVDMYFEVVSAAEYNARIRRGDFQAVLTDLISGPTFGRPYIFWRSAKASKGLNVFGYENAEAERLFQVLRTETSEAAVRSATRRLQQVLLEDPPALFLAWSERTRAIRRDFNVAGESQGDPVLTLWRWTADNTTRNTGVRIESGKTVLLDK